MTNALKLCYTSKIRAYLKLTGVQTMFESIEIRKVANGFIVILNTEDEATEFVFDTSRKAVKFIREYVEGKVSQPA